MLAPHGYASELNELVGHETVTRKEPDLLRATHTLTSFAGRQLTACIELRVEAAKVRRELRLGANAAQTEPRRQSIWMPFCLR